jgi:hypothetical protein
MKLVKTLMIAIATMAGCTFMTLFSTGAYAAAFRSDFKPFWEKLLNILLKLLEMYLETVIKRGFWKVTVPATPVVNAFSNEAERALAARHGLVFDGQTLTVPQDIVLYVRDDVGAALQRGDYSIDAQGNFEFNLVRVVRPVPSPTFPIPGDGGY